MSVGWKVSLWLMLGLFSSNLNLDALATLSVYILLEKEPGLILPQTPSKALAISQLMTYKNLYKFCSCAAAKSAEETSLGDLKESTEPSGYSPLHWLTASSPIVPVCFTRNTGLALSESQPQIFA